MDVLGIHKDPNRKFTLVYHNTDKPFDRYKFECIRPYVKHIYAENCEISHPMITQLPIGFQDKKYVPINFDAKKDMLCYVNLGLYNDRELQFVMCRSIRMHCLDYFQRCPWATVEAQVPHDQFMHTMSRAHFVVCPMGYGLDTHRFYEAYAMGCVPIVVTSGLDPLYEKFGALIVDTWEEVTEERMLKFLLTKKQPFKASLLDVSTYFP